MVALVCRDLVVLEYRKAYNRQGMLWGQDLELLKLYEQNLHQVSDAVRKACELTKSCLI